MLLDEATASLDVENETRVQGALSRLLAGKTVLVIAHRMRTVAGADHIVVLENGRVAQQGSPAAADGRGRPVPAHGGAAAGKRTVAARLSRPAFSGTRRWRRTSRKTLTISRWESSASGTSHPCRC